MRYRKGSRLRHFDYTTPGFYFVTICTQNRIKYFGKIVNGRMRLNMAGEIVQNAWEALPAHYKHCRLDEFIIIPNHIHGIIQIIDQDIVGNGFNPFPMEN